MPSEIVEGEYVSDTRGGGVTEVAEATSSSRLAAWSRGRGSGTGSGVVECVLNESRATAPGVTVLWLIGSETTDRRPVGSGARVLGPETRTNPLTD